MDNLQVEKELSDDEFLAKLSAQYETEKISEVSVMEWNLTIVRMQRKIAEQAEVLGIALDKNSAVHNQSVRLNLEDCLSGIVESFRSGVRMNFKLEHLNRDSGICLCGAANEYQSKNNMLKSKIARLEEDNKKLQEKMARFQSRHEKMQKKHASLKVTYGLLFSGVQKRFKEEKEKMNDKMQEMQTKVNKSQEKCREIENREDVLVKEYKNAIAMLDAQKEQTANIEKTFTELNKLKEQKFDENMENTRKTVEQLKKKLAIARSEASEEMLIRLQREKRIQELEDLVIELGKEVRRKKVMINEEKQLKEEQIAEKDAYEQYSAAISGYNDHLCETNWMLKEKIKNRDLEYEKLQEEFDKQEERLEKAEEYSRKLEEEENARQLNRRRGWRKLLCW
eukprot:gene10248-11302_t